MNRKLVHYLNLPGIADEEFIRDKVPMTKEENSHFDNVQGKNSS